MKTNTSAETLNLNPARHMMRAWIGRVIAWFQYPEVPKDTFDEWCQSQAIEDEHTFKLAGVGLLVVHLGLATLVYVTGL